MLEQGFGGLAARVIEERFVGPPPMAQVAQQHAFDERREVVGDDIAIEFATDAALAP